MMESHLVVECVVPKPILAMDVDGVLNAFGPSGKLALTRAGTPIRIPDGTEERLRVLAGRFEMVWATSWGHAANEELHPLLGIDHPWPVIGFTDDVGTPTWKLPSIFS
jgi:hypothetical protein